MELFIYNSTPGNALWEQDRNTYLRLRGELNVSTRADHVRMAALSVQAQYIFRRRQRNISLKGSHEEYRKRLVETLPQNAPQFFPEVDRFLNLLGVTCSAEDFDNAVLFAIDEWTQSLYAVRDHHYPELQAFFSRLENCETPLDLLFRGLFLARFKMFREKSINIVLFTLFLIMVIANSSSLMVLPWSRFVRTVAAAALFVVGVLRILEFLT
jgi:hypothetical protein